MGAKAIVLQSASVPRTHDESGELLLISTEKTFSNIRLAEANARKE
jgi:hypothetical protein